MKTGILAAAAVLAVGTAGALLRSRYERKHFVVEETVVSSPKITKEVKLVFLSDLHNQEFGEDNAGLISCIRKLDPDMVLVGGDTMVTKRGNTSLDVTEALLRSLTAVCPVYYGNGNHEQRMRSDRETYGDMYDRFRRILKEYGVTYLTDASVDVGEEIRISGLDLDSGYYRDIRPDEMREEYLLRRLGRPDPNRFLILLAHSPLFLPAYASWGANLVLSGHFHGGTIRVPGLGGLMTPQYQFFFPRCAGTFREGDCHMVVSRGLGTHSVNLRLNDRPQVAVIRLIPGGNS